MQPNRRETAAELMARAFTAKIQMRDVVDAAGIPRSTWWRVMKGATPQAGTLEKLSGALDALIARADEGPVP